MKILPYSNNNSVKNTNFGNLSINPKAMKFMLSEIKYNISDKACNPYFPAFLAETKIIANNNRMVNFNKKYLSALEQIFLTVMKETELAFRDIKDFTVTIETGIGKAIKIRTSKDIIPKGDEFGHSLILKGANKYANPEYVAKIVEDLHTLNKTGQSSTAIQELLHK